MIFLSDSDLVQEGQNGNKKVEIVQCVFLIKILTLSEFDLIYSLC